MPSSSAVLRSSSGSVFFSLPESTSSSTLESCMVDLMGISSDHPGQWDFLNADLKKAGFKKSVIIHQISYLVT